MGCTWAAKLTFDGSVVVVVMVPVVVVGPRSVVVELLAAVVVVTGGPPITLATNRSTSASIAAASPVVAQPRFASARAKAIARPVSLLARHARRTAAPCSAACA